VEVKSAQIRFEKNPDETGLFAKGLENIRANLEQRKLVCIALASGFIGSCSRDLLAQRFLLFDDLAAAGGDEFDHAVSLHDSKTAEHAGH